MTGIGLDFFCICIVKSSTITSSYTLFRAHKRDNSKKGNTVTILKSTCQGGVRKYISNRFAAGCSMPQQHPEKEGSLGSVFFIPENMKVEKPFFGTYFVFFPEKLFFSTTYTKIFSGILKFARANFEIFIWLFFLGHRFKNFRLFFELCKGKF